MIKWLKNPVKCQGHDVVCSWIRDDLSNNVWSKSVD